MFRPKKSYHDALYKNVQEVTLIIIKCMLLVRDLTFS